MTPTVSPLALDAWRQLQRENAPAPLSIHDAERCGQSCEPDEPAVRNAVAARGVHDEDEELF